MKKDFVRQVVVFEDHFKEFRKTLDQDTLRKLYQVLTLIMMGQKEERGRESLRLISVERKHERSVKT